jgi:NADPH-dependent 2,4-dienoyl-CoA reductase/sulfur reductase-like enzyme/rhodanese-related sulfurtransferase
MRRVVIVGGVAGGMSAATRLRRLDSEVEIVVLEKSGYVSYANCGLPYYVGGVIEDESALLLQTPKSLHDRFRLDVRVHNEVLGIDREAKSVIVLDRESTEIYTLSYEKLILSTGASPIIPPIEGIERAFTLRTVEDVEAIVQQVAKAPSSAVIIGGGFIGLEIAENFVHKGIHTTIIEAASQVLAPLDPEMAALLEKELSDNGVALYLGASATSITERAVQLSDGREIPADLVILAIGVRPDTSLVREAGLVVGPRGGVSVNEFNLTNDENIYAIGDLAEKIDELDGSATLVPLANLANRHGRVVADHISGKDIRVVKTIGTAIVKVFNLTVATTGWNEKRLKGANIEYLVIHSHPNSHAGYYPDAQQMTLKLLFAPRSGEIFGAQAVGHDGVDKRIDVIATAIRGEISAPELADLELAYAPPFGSAKDPVNMLGYIAENLLSGLVKTAQWNEVDQYLNLGYQVVDVRTATEFADGTLPSAINLPVDEIRERVSELPGKKVLVTCQVGQRGHTATMYLKSLGYDAVNLDGGYLLWSNSPAKVSHKRKAISNV